MDEEFGPDDDPARDRIKPGNPKLEHVAFVLFGVLTALAVIVDLANLLG